ncbi:UNVERIFIED_CONTAM: hypothetical protein GTU68_012560 [Idotea baltica]|nr:hypothetical protein [Idotea baltica]
MVFTAIGIGIASLLLGGLWSYALLIYAFGIIPLTELLFKPNPDNLNKAELELVKADRLYDLLLYLVVPVQFGLVFLFAYQVMSYDWLWWELVGMTWAVGICCGILGINVAHELGHRTKKYEQLLAKSLLLSSLYMHFFIEHNRGHHANVSTPDDPASARRGEVIFAFWSKSVWFSYLSAWKLENRRLRKKDLPVFSLQNEMLVYQLAQLGFIGLIYGIFGLQPMLLFLAASGVGILLLETVNYIEHYGLQREMTPYGRYEQVQPHHSWNSDHPVGRLLLFELSRHSDHHHRAGRKFQTLRHIENTPQMPTGYPGMMVLALLPPLWFAVMNPKVDRLHSSGDHNLAFS